MLSKSPFEWTTALYAAIFIALFLMLGNEAHAQQKPKSKVL